MKNLKKGEGDPAPLYRLLRLWYIHTMKIYPSASLKPIALVLLLVTAGCGKKDASPEVARFRQEIITEKEYKEKLSRLPQGLRGIALSNKKEFLEDLVAERLLLSEAKHRKIEALPDVKLLMEAARKKILVAKLIELEIDDKITVGAEEPMLYYEGHKEEFMTPVLLRASNILVKTEEDARQIKKELEAGADFEDTARKKSLDAAALRGGDLGYFQKGQYAAEFEEAAFKLKKGELSDVVKTRFGYHLIKLTDQMEPQMRDYNSVKKAIEEKILKEKRASAFKRLLAKLKDGSEVRLDEKALDAASV